MEHQSLSQAADAAKQIITIGTAVLTLTVTFAKDTLVKNRNQFPFSLGTSWVMFLFSIFSGVWCLLSITAELERKNPSIWSTNVSAPAFMMSLGFVLGVAFTIIAGWQAVNRSLQAPIDLEAADDSSTSSNFPAGETIAQPGGGTQTAR